MNPAIPDESAAGPPHVLYVMEATIGGTRRHLVDAVLGLLERGARVDVVAAARRQPDFVEDLAALERAGAWVRELPMVREIRPLTDRRHRRELVAILRERRPQIVHTHSSKAGVLGRSASLAAGVGRRIHTPHTFAFLFEAMFSKPKRRLLFAIEKHYARTTDAVVAVSETEAESIRRSGVVPKGRVRVVQNGVDPRPWAQAQPHPRAELGVPEHVPLAGVVGLLNVAKGQDLLLEALAQCATQNLHLLIAGSGELEGQLRERCAQLELTERVHFLGFRHDAPALVAACDFVCLPSRWEGMPYIALEAMAAGKAVLATAVDGARELVLDGQTGFIVPIGDVAAIADRIDRLVGMTQAERDLLGRRGAERAASGFTRDTMVASLLELYREVLASGEGTT